MDSIKLAKCSIFIVVDSVLLLTINYGDLQQNYLRWFIFFVLSQWTNTPKKQSEECIFYNMALYFECRSNKNALFQTVY